MRRPVGRVRAVRETRASRMARNTGFRGSELRESENWRDSRASSSGAERASMMMPRSDAQVHYDDELARPSRPAPRTTGTRSEASHSRASASQGDASHSSSSMSLVAKPNKETVSEPGAAQPFIPDCTRVLDGTLETLRSVSALGSWLLVTSVEIIRELWSWIEPIIPDIKDYLSWFGFLNVILLIYQQQIGSTEATRTAFVAMLLWWLQKETTPQDDNRAASVSNPSTALMV